MYIKPVGQHTPTHCNILQHTATVVAFVMYVKPVGGVCLNKATCCVLNKATRCVLDDKATCSVLVRYATPRVQKDLFCACVPCARVQTRNALLHCYVVPTATHCNTLQHTAIHCNTLCCAVLRCYAVPTIHTLPTLSPLFWKRGLFWLVFLDKATQQCKVYEWWARSIVTTSQCDGVEVGSQYCHDDSTPSHCDAV